MQQQRTSLALTVSLLREEVLALGVLIRELHPAPGWRFSEGRSGRYGFLFFVDADGAIEYYSSRISTLEREARNSRLRATALSSGFGASLEDALMSEGLWRGLQYERFQ